MEHFLVGIVVDEAKGRTPLKSNEHEMDSPLPLAQPLFFPAIAFDACTHSFNAIHYLLSNEIIGLVY